MNDKLSNICENTQLKKNSQCKKQTLSTIGQGKGLVKGIRMKNIF